MKQIAVFGSGNGSNFEAIVKYFQRQDVRFVCVSDKSNCYMLERAEKLNIESHYIPFGETLDFLKSHNFDLVVLAGYMRVLPAEVVNHARIINIHPSLLPEFKGKDAIKRAYEAKVKQTGVTVHYVNEGVDTGLVIAQLPITIEVDMTLSELEQKIHTAEHQLYPQVIDHLLFDKPLLTAKSYPKTIKPALSS